MAKSPTKKDNVGLKKEIGILQGVSIIVGVIVGSGIFVSPVGVLRETGSVGLSFVIWILTGFFSLIGAIVYAELGVTIPKSGGEYAYILEAFGPLPSFLCLWINFFLIGTASVAANSIIFAEYILKPFFAYCSIPHLPQLLIAIFALMTIIAINAYSVNWATKTAIIFTICKVSATLIITGLGLYYIIIGNVSSFEGPFENSNFSLGKLAMAYYQGFWAYAGWNYLNFLTEEMRNPQRNLPLAIVISLLLVTGIYLLVNVAYLGVLSPGQLLDSTAVAVTFAERCMGRFSFVMPLFVGCSVFGSINGEVLSMTRLPYAGAKEGHMPTLLAMVSCKFLTPLPSIILMFILSLAFQMFSQLRYLIELTGFAFCVIAAMAVGGLIWMRLTRNDLPKSFRLPLWVPIVFLVIDLFILAISIYENPTDFLFSSFLIASGVPVYLLGVAWRPKPSSFRSRIDGLTRGLQKLLLVVGQEEDRSDDVSAAPINNVDSLPASPSSNADVVGRRPLKI